MTSYMLDTNIVSFFVRGHAQVDRRIVAVPITSLCISAITEGELLYGLHRQPQARGIATEVMEFLRRVDVLPWDRPAAQKYGVVRAAQERLGKGLSAMDMLIAAHALSSGSTLVTNDAAFQQVPGLTVEDWTQPTAP